MPCCLTATSQSLILCSLLLSLSGVAQAQLPPVYPPSLYPPSPTPSAAPVYPPPPSPSPSPSPVTPPPLVPVRLVNGIANATYASGRVEVYHEASASEVGWGTVCDELWSDSDAVVVCKLLGYTAGKASVGAVYGEGALEMPIWLSEVSCNGTENTLASCGNGGWGIHSCTHAQDAGVECWNASAVPPSPSPTATPSPPLNPVVNKTVVVTLRASVSDCASVGAEFRARYMVFLNSTFCGRGQCSVAFKEFTCTTTTAGRRQLLAAGELTMAVEFAPSLNASDASFMEVADQVTAASASSSIMPVSLMSAYGINSMRAVAVLNNPTPQPDPETAPAKKKDNTGTIVGAVIGSVAGVAILAGTAYFINNRRQRIQTVRSAFNVKADTSKYQATDPHTAWGDNGAGTSPDAHALAQPAPPALPASTYMPESGLQHTPLGVPVAEPQPMPGAAPQPLSNTQSLPVGPSQV